MNIRAMSVGAKSGLTSPAGRRTTKNNINFTMRKKLKKDDVASDDHPLKSAEVSYQMHVFSLIRAT